MTKRFFAIMIITVAGGCKPITVERPQAQDAGPIFGCYTAPGAPHIDIAASGIRFAGSSELVSFRYELPKMGTVLRIPRDASIIGEQLVFRPSEERFYQVLHTNAGPVIRVAFGPQGMVKDYRRQPPNDCRG